MDHHMETTNYNREKMIKQIEVYYNTRKFEKVIEKSLELLQENPEDLEVLYYLCDSYIALDHFDEAEECIQKIMRDYPESPVGYSLMGEYYLKKEKYDEAIPYFEQCISINPETGFFYRCIASALISGSYYRKRVHWFPKLRLKQEEVDRILRAIDYLNLSIEYDPEILNNFILMANAYDLLFQTEISYEYAQKALLLDPTSVEAHAFLAFFQIVYGDLQNARFHCEQILMYEPNDGRALEFLNEIKIYETDTEKYYNTQIQYWSFRSRFYPTNTHYLQKLINIKLSYGKHQPINELKKYLKLKPEDLEMQITYGKALYDKKYYLKAEQHFKKLQQDNPANPYIQDWLDTLSKIPRKEKYELVERKIYIALIFLFFIIFFLISPELS